MANNPRRMSRRMWPWIGACAATVWLAGCAATAPTVHTRQAPGLNLAAFRKFTFVPKRLDVHRSEQMLRLEWAKDDVARALEARGYTRSTAHAAPGLLVHVEFTEPHGTGAAPHRPAEGPGAAPNGPWAAPNGPAHRHSGSALTIYLIARANESVIWRATAVWPWPIRSIQHPRRMIQQAVSTIFERFPVKSAR